MFNADFLQRQQFHSSHPFETQSPQVLLPWNPIYSAAPFVNRSSKNKLRAIAPHSRVTSKSMCRFFQEGRLWRKKDFFPSRKTLLIFTDLLEEFYTHVFASGYDSSLKAKRSYISPVLELFAFWLTQFTKHFDHKVPFYKKQRFVITMRELGS